MGTIAERLDKVRLRIDEITQQANRQTPPDLCLVSKRQSCDKILDAFAAGHTLFGENYVSELLEKASTLPSSLKWVFIGQLQSNKVRALIKKSPNLVRIESVDSASLADKLQDACLAFRGDCPPLELLIQVNTSNEITKSGLNASEVQDLAMHILKCCSRCQFRGLMTIASNETSRAAVEFSGLVSNGGQLLDFFQEQIQAGELPAESVNHLCPGGFWNRPDAKLFYSMGMSGDMKEAIMAGSSQVRIGTLVFGAR